MKSIYFLPNTGIEKFDDINEKLKLIVSHITEVISFRLDKLIDFYPENFENDIPELIFIPTIFDHRNAVSYQGVEFALHWYFHLISLNPKCKFKIVLLGTEDKAAFFKNCNYSNILKCPNIDYLPNSYEEINKYLFGCNIKEFDQKEALEKINLIDIKPPTSYKTHHSIANEWSILRWSKALNIDVKAEKELKKIEDNIETSLYYKYLNTKHTISLKGKFKSKTLVNPGKILFIDDEVERGWDIIFKTICGAKSYSSFGKDFKNWEQSKIIDESLKKAKDADVIILDLRLHDGDFDERDPKKITGYQLLKKIKEHNKGIQVIVFSATNKIWNLQALQGAGADGFILKESPEDSIDEKFTSQSIENIYKTIDGCLEYSFVIDYYDVYNDLELILVPKIKSKELDKVFVNEYLRWLNFAINNLIIYKNDEGITISFLMFFTVLENLCNRIIDIDNYERDLINSERVYKFKFRSDNTYLKEFDYTNDYYSKTKKILLSKNSRPNWGQKILNTISFLSVNQIDNELKMINQLIKKRNDIIHSNVTTGNKISISIIELNNLFNLITTNIDKIK